MKITEKYTFFWKDKISQWNMQSFIDHEGIEYNCAEQYMMAKKAELFGDIEAYNKIMAAEHPREQQKIGREVSNFVQKIWDANKISIVCQGNLYRFSQNENLKEILISTKGTTLVEASPIDAIWGIALAEDDKDALDIKKWRGENLLGYILTSLRDNYFLKRDHLLLKSTTRGTGLFKNDYRANYFEIKHLADNEKLKNKINRWNKDTITEESIWIEEGRKIAKELKELVGEDYIVKYLWEDSQEKEVITL